MLSLNRTYLQVNNGHRAVGNRDLGTATLDGNLDRGRVHILGLGALAGIGPLAATERCVGRVLACTARVGQVLDGDRLAGAWETIKSDNGVGTGRANRLVPVVEVAESDTLGSAALIGDVGRESGAIIVSRGELRDLGAATGTNKFSSGKDGIICVLGLGGGRAVVAGLPDILDRAIHLLPVDSGNTNGHEVHHEIGAIEGSGEGGREGSVGGAAGLDVNLVQVVGDSAVLVALKKLLHRLDILNRVGHRAGVRHKIRQGARTAEAAVPVVRGVGKVIGVIVTGVGKDVGGAPWDVAGCLATNIRTGKTDATRQASSLGNVAGNGLEAVRELLGSSRGRIGAAIKVGLVANLNSGQVVSANARDNRLGGLVGLCVVPLSVGNLGHPQSVGRGQELGQGPEFGTDGKVTRLGGAGSRDDRHGLRAVPKNAVTAKY